MPSEDALAEIKYQIYETGCDILYADFTDTSSTKAMFFNRTVEDTSTDTVAAYLGMNYTTIGDSNLWTSLNDTHAEMKFCGRFIVEYDGVFVNFHETDLTVTVNVVSDSMFESESVSLDMVQASEVGKYSEVTMDYPLQVFHCDENAVELGSPPTEITQGTAVQLCVSLATPREGVYVENIYSMTYWSELFPGQVSSVVSNGTVTNGVSQLDCTQVPGVCRILFIASANIFYNDVEASNSLVVDGEAVLAVGTDTRRRLLYVNDVQSSTRGNIFRSHFHLKIRQITTNRNALVFFAVSLGNIIFGMSLCSLMMLVRHGLVRRRKRNLYDYPDTINLVTLSDEELV
jgi:hypothetical protein